MEPAFAADIAHLLDSLQREGGDTIINTGSGGVVTRGGVAAGKGGVAIQGDVHGNVSLGASDKKG